MDQELSKRMRPLYFWPILSYSLGGDEGWIRLPTRHWVAVASGMYASS